jgi:hypothetical protein
MVKETAPMSRDQGKQAAGHSGCLLLFLGPCLFFSAGCQSSNAFLEAELRSRDQEVRNLREELAWREQYTQSLKRQVQASPPGTVTLLPPMPTGQAHPIKQITLGRQTGGLDEDRQPGAEALRVVVEPRDMDGKPIKVPGTIHVGALQLGRDGQEKALCAWDITPEALRATWRYSLLSTGYHLVLPWKAWPETDHLRLVVHLTLPDGRTFETDRTVVVRVPPPDVRKKIKAPLVARQVARPPAPPARLPPPPPSAPVARPVFKPREGPETYLADAVKLDRPLPLRNRFFGNP